LPLVIQVQVGELVAGGGEGLEVRGERDARQVALEVVGKLGAIAGMVNVSELGYTDQFGE